MPLLAQKPLVWVSLLIGLAGVAMIIKPGPQLFHKPASLIALLAGLFSALALVATNKLADTEPPVRILIYNFGFSTLALIPLCICVWKPLKARKAFKAGDHVSGNSEAGRVRHENVA